MKIIHKLSLSFLSISFLLAVLGWFALKTNIRIERETDGVVHQSLKQTKITAKILKNFLLLDIASRKLHLDITYGNKQNRLKYSSLQEIEDILSKIKINIDESKQLELQERNILINIDDIQSLNEFEIDKELKILKAIEINLNTYHENLGYFLDILHVNPKGAYGFYEHLIKTNVRDEMLPLIEKYYLTNLQQLELEALDVENSLYHANIFIGIAVVLGIFIALGLGLLISRSISQPIRELEATAFQIGQGKLDSLVNIDLNRKDELGTLAKTFNQMVAGLKNSTVSKSFLDNILGSMLDSLIVLDLQGQIQKVNQATITLLGYTEEELIGKSILLLLVEQSQSTKQKTWLPQNFLGNREINYLHQDGTVIPVAFSSSFILNDQNEAKGVVCLARDITEKHLAEKALKESEERYSLASRATNDGLWDWNLKTKHIYFSPRWKFLLGYEEYALSNSPDEWFQRVHPDYLEELSRLISSIIQNSLTNFEISYPMQHRDGNYRWMLCRGIAVPDENGEVYRLTGSQTDITNSRQALEQLRHDALHDKLTGLPNRSYFLEELRKCWQIAHSGEHNPFAIMFLDLDRFKYINDSLGHQAGDQLLIEFARRLKTCLSSHHLMARLGGDEFTILLRKVNLTDDAIQLAQNIQKQLQLPFYLENQEIFVSSSIGIVMSNDRYQKVEDLLRDADTAMYQAKSSGKNRYRVFEVGMHQKAKAILGIENDLRRAIERAELTVFYQPIVQLNSRKITGFEALIRWLHPQKGMIFPSDFISLAEETGLIVPLGWYILEKACTQMHQWQQKYRVASSMSLSVNLSPLQLEKIQKQEQSHLISQILHKTGLHPHSLNLEITEGTLIGNVEQIVPVLEALRKLGLKLSMDDFGTGYSSLSYLHRLPIDNLKIDRSFINQMNLGTENLELVKTIVNLAEKMRINVIAEGVETMEQVTILEELNCAYGQGYLFSKPINSEGIEILLDTIEQVNKWKYTSKYYELPQVS